MDMVTVVVAYPGASPQEVEEGVVLAIEDEISSLDGIKKINSISVEGLGTVMAELLTGAKPGPDGPTTSKSTVGPDHVLPAGRRAPGHLAVDEPQAGCCRCWSTATST